MVFPAQTLNVIDPGLGQTAPVANIPIMSGVSTGGSIAVNTLKQINNLNDVRTLIGYGALAEDVALALSQRGGPISFVLHNSVDSKALSGVSLVKEVGSGPTITVSGTPNDRYNLRIKITLGGTLGVAKYQYSLDAWDTTSSAPSPITWSQERLTPGGGTFLLPNTGLTLTFPAGTYVLNDIYTLTTIPKEVLTADLASVATLLSGNTLLDFNLWGVSGQQDDKTTGAALAASFQGYLTTLTQSFRYVRGFMDVGSGDAGGAAAVATAAATWTGSRICPSFGLVVRPSLLPFEGFSYRKCSASAGVFVRAATVLISTDLSRFASGPDSGVLWIGFDGFADQSLDAVKISTMRTWPAAPGFYFANGKLHSAFGSDFIDVQYGRVMDVACRTTYLSQLNFESESFRTITGGAIDPRDAKQMESVVQKDLNNNIMSPNNARGVPGHASSVVYAVDLSQDIVTTGQLKSSVAMRPLGYSKVISTDLFFTRN